MVEPRIGQMYVKLVSEDRDLYKLCRESLNDIPGHAWDISAVAGQEHDDASDLWLWDYQPAMVLPEFTSHSPSKHLFLVARNDLTSFRSRASVDAHILLKPVTRATLAAPTGPSGLSRRRAEWRSPYPKGRRLGPGVIADAPTDSGQHARLKIAPT